MAVYSKGTRVKLPDGRQGKVDGELNGKAVVRIDNDGVADVPWEDLEEINGPTGPGDGI